MITDFCHYIALTGESVIINMLIGVINSKWKFSFQTLTLDVQRVTCNITRLIKNEITRSVAVETLVTLLSAVLDIQKKIHLLPLPCT